MIILIDHNYPTDEAVFDAHEERLARLCRKLLDITPSKKARDVDHMVINVVTQVADQWVNAILGFDIVAHETLTLERGDVFTDSLDDYYGHPSLTMLRAAHGNEIQHIASLSDEQITVEIEI